MSIRKFVDHNYRHFNAAALRAAAIGYESHLSNGGKMFLAMAGAMSTAELGISLAQMIRKEKVHAICCTGANLEEDIFNLVAHNHYKRIPNFRNLTPEDEKDLERSGLNRVTDTCIPEEKAFRIIEKPMLELWKRADVNGESFFPHEFIYQLIREESIVDNYQIDPENSWVLAAAEKDLPIFIPGWEDSTLGNVFVAHALRGHLKSIDTVRSGAETLKALAEWYVRETMDCSIIDLPELGAEYSHEDVALRVVSKEGAKRTIGFFQIGGGIAGDFPICVVPMIHQDMRKPCPYWGYFCQISDSTTSYGSYSGAIPTEKITWGKLGVDTPMYVVESDATIVAPLIFEYLLEE